MGERSYLSIGEVLSLLRPEFPDLTISKIRFLESQGLLDPERTPSGYRKFYEPDVDRLRWILTQQREQYLPLKVIKGRLGADGEPLDDDAEATVTTAVRDRDHDAAAEENRPSVEPATRPRVEGERLPPASPAAAAAHIAPLAIAADNPLHLVRTGVSMTIDELANATELRIDQIRELEQYGILSGRTVGGTVYYDEECLVAANLAAGFLRYGVEPRHLRMYKTAAEREAGFFEQLVMPMLKQRNPRSRKQAMDTLVELARLGQGLRAAMLRTALRDHTNG